MRTSLTTRSVVLALATVLNMNIAVAAPAGAHDTAMVSHTVRAVRIAAPGASAAAIETPTTPMTQSHPELFGAAIVGLMCAYRWWRRGRLI